MDMDARIPIKQHIHNLLKKEHWDAVEVIGQTVSSFKVYLEVSNYPIRRLTPEKANELKRIKSIRGI